MLACCNIHLKSTIDFHHYVMSPTHRSLTYPPPPPNFILFYYMLLLILIVSNNKTQHNCDRKFSENVKNRQGSEICNKNISPASFWKTNLCLGTQEVLNSRQEARSTASGVERQRSKTAGQSPASEHSHKVSVELYHPAGSLSPPPVKPVSRNV